MKSRGFNASPDCPFIDLTKSDVRVLDALVVADVDKLVDMLVGGDGQLQDHFNQLVPRVPIHVGTFQKLL